MGRLLDEIIVVDVESTCWPGLPPPGEASDIIEIGICRLDVSSLERLEKRSLFVRPARSKVSPFCTELTTITPDDVEGGCSLREACEILKKGYLSKRRLWASFGDYDRRQFQRNCAALDVAYPFGPGHLNVKSLLAVSLGLEKELDLAAALRRLRYPLEGTHHRGDDDAWNIALILAHLLRAEREFERT